jgi:nicotinamide-nucleotide amidase
MYKEQMVEFQKRLKNSNKTITCAESCTGGLIASKITEISGSSSIFKGSVVTYCNDIKEQELNVNKQTMIKNGVVSIQVVNEMLDGVLKKFDSNIAIAVSGIAGPTGGSKEKPVGTVVIGIKSTCGYVNIQKYFFTGSRIDIQKKATFRAFEIIFDKF